MQPSLERASTGEPLLVWRHSRPVTALSVAYGADLDVTIDDGQILVVPRRRRPRP